MEQVLVTVSSKGQMVIPAKIREELAIKAGTKVSVSIEGGRVIVDPQSLEAKLRRIKEIEREIKHDIASLVRALAEACGTSGAYVHLGATSYDIVDTATALQLKDALQLIDVVRGAAEAPVIAPNRVRLKERERDPSPT